MAKDEHNLAVKYSNNILALLDQGLVSASSFLVAVCVGRFGSDEQLGLYGLGTAVIVAFVSLHESLISMPYIFLGDKEDDIKSYTGSSIGHVGMLSGAAIVILLLGASLGLFGLLPAGLGFVLLAVSLIVPFHLMRQFVRRYFFSVLDLRGLLVFDAIACGVQIGLVLLLWKFDLLLGATGHLVVGLAGMVMSILWLAMYKSEFTIARSTMMKHLRSNWEFGKYVAGAQFMWILHMHLLTWILFFSQGEQQAGQFSACLAITLLANPFVLGMLNIVSPRVVRGYAEGGNQQLRAVVWQNWWFMVAGVALLFILLAFLGGRVVEAVFGPEYANHQATITLLALAMLAETACKTPEHGIAAIGKPHLITYINAFRLVITLVLAVVLIPQRGLGGAAWSLVIADTVGAVLLSYTFLRHTSGYTNLDAQCT